MLRGICNREVAINEEEKNFIGITMTPFYPIFVKRTYRKSFKNNVNR